jgi:ABC-type Fe3+-hydroxamate transport system substrate-binding protein
MPFRRIALFVALLALAVPAAARAQHAPRIVVLIPSFAEDAVAVGAAGEVVGVSRFSSDIPEVRRAPRVADFESVDVERIVALHPDMVIGLPSQARLTAPLTHAGLRVVLMPDDSYDDIFLDLRRIGALTGHAAQAQHVIARLQRETAALHARAERMRTHPSVFVALGTGPIWTAGRGSYIDRLIELAGGRNAAHDLDRPWGEYGEEALLRDQPDAIVAGYDTDLRAVATREPWRSLRAVREGHVFTMTDHRIANALFRPGPRYVEGLRWLIQQLSSLSTPTTHSGR